MPPVPTGIPHRERRSRRRARPGDRPRPRPHPPVRPLRPPARRLTPGTLYVDPHGRGDFTSVQAAVTAATGSGRTLVIAPGRYRETGRRRRRAYGDDLDRRLREPAGRGDRPRQRGRHPQARRRYPRHQRFGDDHRTGRRVHRALDHLRQRLAARRPPGRHRHPGRRPQGAGRPRRLPALPLPRPPGHPVRRLPGPVRLRPPVLRALLRRGRRRLRLRPGHRGVRALPTSAR